MELLRNEASWDFLSLLGPGRYGHSLGLSHFFLATGLCIIVGPCYVFLVGSVSILFYKLR